MKRAMPVEQKPYAEPQVRVRPGEERDAPRQEEDAETELSPSKTEEGATPHDLNSLREIIFGPIAREYNTKLRAFDRRLEELQQAAEERYTDLSAKLDQKFEGLSSELNEKLRELDKQITDRVEQAASKGEADLRKISTLFDNLAQEIREKMERLTNSQTSQLTELREQLKRNYDTLRRELVAETDTLDERKLNRSVIAEGLIELGMKLKDETFLDELSTQLADRT